MRKEHVAKVSKHTLAEDENTVYCTPLDKGNGDQRTTRREVSSDVR